MKETLYYTSLAIILAPLVGATLAGFWGKTLGRTWTHRVTIFCVGVAFVLSLFMCKLFLLDKFPTTSINIYAWAISGSFHFNVGFLLDPLTAFMIATVTFVSLLVHIYTIGYMADDEGYQRFFSYISLFTFMMLMLVMANNFMQLFFGWEGVGLVSYLLIGFWFKRESANFGSLKAFIVNRVGDFGFILGIAAILDYFGTVDYQQVFTQAGSMSHHTLSIWPGAHWSVITVICILLFIGAMGKSAQMPLHVWLPESMEGPTPISALIHAATMVTAGVYMVSRMSPLYEYSQVALSFVLIIGASGALFTGIIGVVQNDIKRVVAYSTLSQLGYMIAALGVSAFSAGMFHLMTHACFKALLFLAAGSVIIAMHHDQDMRNMGGLRKYMPITYVCFLIGGLALSAIPPFAGYYSKDAIIEAIHASNVPGSTYAYYCVLFGAFITALYTFRAFFLTFHGKERMDENTRGSLKESPWVVWLPLVALAIPSTIIGFIVVGPILYAKPSLLGSSIFVLPSQNILQKMAADYHGPWATFLHAFKTLPFWFALSGVVVAWLFYLVYTDIPAKLTQRCQWLYSLIVNKYGFDDFNQLVLTNGTTRIARWFFYIADVKFIDDFFVNGTGRVINWVSKMARMSQTGYLYHYAFAMIIGLLIFLGWILL